MRPAPPLDPIGADYVSLAFAIDRLVPGFVDAYFGPESQRTLSQPADAGTPQTLLERVSSIRTRLAAETAAVPADRRAFLDAQLAAMAGTLRRLAGDEMPYVEEVRSLFAIDPIATPESTFTSAIAELDRVLPGSGSVAARLSAWRQRSVVSPESARRAVDAILPELQRRTAEIAALPEGESVDVQLVADQPWSAYNWYHGGGRSRVELNTDLPIYAYKLTDLLCHEAYPGHHTEHVLKERLYVDRGRGEHAIQLINTPECVVSEGIATLAEEVLFTPVEVVEFRAEVLYPAAGIVGDPEREGEIGRALAALRPVAANAALLLHEVRASAEEVTSYIRRYALKNDAEARQQLRFIADPLWRAYIFTYHAGHRLLGAWVNAADGAERRARFRTLLSEPVTPGWVSAQIGGGETTVQA